MQCLCLAGLHTVPFHPMGDGQCAKSQILTFKSVVLNNHQDSIFTYPSFILDVDVGFFQDKAFYYGSHTAFGNCNMQGSLLIEERRDRGVLTTLTHTM